MYNVRPIASNITGGKFNLFERVYVRSLHCPGVLIGYECKVTNGYRHNYVYTVQLDCDYFEGQAASVREEDLELEEV